MSLLDQRSWPQPSLHCRTQRLTQLHGSESLTVREELEPCWAAPHEDAYAGDDDRDGHVYEHRPPRPGARRVGPCRADERGHDREGGHAGRVVVYVVVRKLSADNA